MKGFNWKCKEINWKWKDFNWKWKDFNWKVGCQIARAAASKSTKCKMYDYVLQNRKQPKESLRRKSGATWQHPAATSSSQQQPATGSKSTKMWMSCFFAAKKKRSYRHGPDSLKQGRKNRNCKSRRRQESMIFSKMKEHQKMFLPKENGGTTMVRFWRAVVFSWRNWGYVPETL